MGQPRLQPLACSPDPSGTTVSASGTYSFFYYKTWSILPPVFCRTKSYWSHKVGFKFCIPCVSKVNMTQFRIQRPSDWFECVALVSSVHLSVLALNCGHVVDLEESERGTQRAKLGGWGERKKTEDFSRNQEALSSDAQWNLDNPRNGSLQRRTWTGSVNVSQC